MTIEACIKKISRYLQSENANPLIVDVQNIDDMERLKVQFKVDGNIFLAASEFSNHDALPRFEVLISEIKNSKANVFITEITSFLKLLGECELKSQLGSIMHMSMIGKVVIFSYQCQKYLHFSDSRLDRSICIVEGRADSIPNVIFTTGKIPLSESCSVEGVENIARVFETTKLREFYVITQKNKQEFGQSVYPISSIDNSYEIIARKDATIFKIDKKIGSPARWDYLLTLFEEENLFIDIVNRKFGNYQSLEIAIPNFTLYDDNQKWLYFVSLKLFGAKNNECLDFAARHASSMEQLVQMIFRSILELDYSDANFQTVYKERKSILIALKNPNNEVVDYCNIIRKKAENAIYYLTDSTKQEKELIIELLDKYGTAFDIEQLQKLLTRVYPDLAEYLEPYRYKISLLERYFPLYKYCKVINRIKPEFLDLVREQSIKREFNILLEPRYSQFEKISRKNAGVYFVDALGVEYLSFILAKCKERGLIAKVTVGRSNLPTITSCNKEFMEVLSKENIPICSVKELDDLKHEGISEYDYQKTKLPIHLIKELEIIQELIDTIYTKLEQDKFDKAILVSDHGASRLAVLHETENIYEMESKGKHSGRCCPKSEVDIKSDVVVDAEEFWVLADYDRFKGGRKASVEVHGGATLEEVVVPIVEISKIPREFEISIIDKEITVSYRKKAAIRLFTKNKVSNVSVKVAGVIYDSKEIEYNTYLVEMPKVKKPDTYSVEVFVEGNLVASDLNFTVVKEGAQERDIL